MEKKEKMETFMHYFLGTILGACSGAIYILIYVITGLKQLNAPTITAIEAFAVLWGIVLPVYCNTIKDLIKTIKISSIIVFTTALLQKFCLFGSTEICALLTITTTVLLPLFIAISIGCQSSPSN